MRLSNLGLEMIASFEGCRLEAYKALSTEEYYTIGYGHYGADVKKGDKITAEEALALLRKDVATAEEKVNRFMSIYNFNQNQFDALVSFAFNIGNIKQLTNNGTRTIAEIENVWTQYCNSGGKKIAGLVARRERELKLFKTPCEQTTMFIKPKPFIEMKLNYFIRDKNMKVIANTYAPNWGYLYPIEYYKNNFVKVENENGEIGYINSSAFKARMHFI